MASFAQKQFLKLDKSIKWSNKQLTFARRKRIEAIKMLVGFHHSEDGYPAKEYVNSLALAVMIYVRLLAARSPRVIMSHPEPKFMPTAANFELAINKIPDEIGLDSTLRRLVLEAIFSMGIAKVGLTKVGTALNHAYGESFVDIVTIDDYFCDMSAKDMNLIDYEGNDYWLDYDEVMESEMGKKVGDLKPDDYVIIGPNGEKRAESIAQSGSAEVFKDKIWLRDVWLPSEKLLITYGVTSEKVFNTVDWDAPRGPYHKLGYSDVPGNLLPLAPVSLWRDLHELENNCFRKLADGAEAQKEVLGFGGGDDQSVLDFKGAKDGDGIKYTGAEPKKLVAGGVNANTMAFAMQARDLFSYFAGNLDSLGGLGLAAQTVGQEKLLGDAAGAQLRDMADRTVGCIKGVFHALAWYEWNDPIKRRTLQKPIPGLNDTIPVEWNREAKIGKFSAYDLKIDVFSYQDDSPSLMLQKLLLFIERVVTPLVPFIQQAGGTIDAEKIIKMAAKYSGLPPDVCEIVIFPETSDQASAGAGAPQQSPGMPANTTRTYERVGRPGMTREGASRNMQQMLMGSDPGGDSSAS